MRWLPVVGYEGLYEVSDEGNVISLRTGRLLKHGFNQRGHSKVWLFNSDGKSRHYIHVLMLTAFVGPRPDGMISCHIDDNKSNNTIDNLKWGSYSENMYDRVRNGIHYSSNKTHCKRGHPLEYPNLRKWKDFGGRGTCLACRRAMEVVRNQNRLDDKEYIQFVSDSKYQKILQDASRISVLEEVL